MGEPVEGGVGATTHSAHNQRGGWGRGGDALGAGDEGDTRKAPRECWGQATGEREGKAGGGKNNNGGTAPAAGQGKIAVLANLWARQFFFAEIISFRQSIGKNIYAYAFFRGK